MTFRVCVLEVGCTSYYDCTTIDWEHFDLVLIQEYGIEGWGPDRVQLVKTGGKWTSNTMRNPERQKALQREIDDFFFHYGTSIHL